MNGRAVFAIGVALGILSIAVAGVALLWPGLQALTWILLACAVVVMLAGHGLCTDEEAADDDAPE